MIEIRAISEDEVSLALPLFRQYLDEARFSPDFSPHAFEMTWKDYITSGTGVIFGAFENGEAVGGLGGMMIYAALDGKPWALESMWYVKPEHRNCGMALLRRFEGWAKSMNAVRILATTTIGLKHEELGKVLEHRGYRALETHYVMEVA